MGAHGVADGDVEPADIVAELVHVLNGTPRVPYSILRRAIAHAPLIPPFVPPEYIQVLRWCIQGLTVYQISELRGEHKRTTERFIDKIIADLHCENRYETILQCERWGYLDEVMNGQVG